MIALLILGVIGLPLTFAAALFVSRTQNESVISNSAIATMIGHSVLWVALTGVWLAQGAMPIDVFWGPLVRLGDYQFDLSFQVDELTIIFLFLVSFIGSIAVKYSQYYMHREPGYLRFFVNVLVFLGGISLLATAGTLDLLFAGWEIVGLSSFLLIAFYREREQPSRHALRTYSIYRLCDTGVLLGAWLSHLVWHSSPTFSDLDSPALLAVLRQTGEAPLLGLTALVVLAAAGKSAQFPFTFWLPRAMEGPTPSSAVFYGALSVHAGAFLLMRMYPVWQASFWGPYLVGGIGLTTLLSASFIGRGQSNIKGQIAYASAAQVGLIFVELALGLKSLALFHLAGNALLRCFQLLVSPSIVAFVLRWQGAGGGTHWALEKWRRHLPPRWTATFYVFGLSEGYFEQALRAILWKPVRAAGGFLATFSKTQGWTLVSLATAACFYASYSGREGIAARVLVLASIGLASFALSSWGRTVRAWDFACFTGVLLALAIWIREPSALSALNLMVVNNAVAWAIGRRVLMRWERRLGHLELGSYSALVQSDPQGCFFFLVSFLLVAGFPIGPGFLAEDLLLHHTVVIGGWATAALGLVFVINGIALCRIFVRTCYGEANA